MASLNGKKRIIVCCDGTWQNSDNGYVKPTPSNPVATLQVATNVTRISRSFSRVCSDGTFQIIYYQSGVGSGNGFIDRITGGAFGMGIAENIREAYAYICANYIDGDEIVLVGFSRGAFTARSVAGMISDLGLLTREGMDYFYPVFKDMQHWRSEHYNDPFPDLPFPNKPYGPGADVLYRQKLVERGYSRVRENGGEGALIRVKAVAVWDTVGSLGIPNVELLSRLGIKRSTVEFQWYNTKLSNKIQHAFQALAMDETRGPFSPAVWEREPGKQEMTDLRQVWFPGNHGNVGGGWPDAGIANMSLAWMMDQLSSVDVEFVPDALDRLFERNIEYYNSLQSTPASQGCGSGILNRRPRFWAAKKIYEANKPVRPWGLHALKSASTFIYKIAGLVPRTPGLYKRINPRTGLTTKTFLKDTNERVHSSVRVRIACQGLGLEDKRVWQAPALSKRWQLRRIRAQYHDPIPKDAAWGPPESEQEDLGEEVGGTTTYSDVGSSNEDGNGSAGSHANASNTGHGNNSDERLTSTSSPGHENGSVEDQRQTIRSVHASSSAIGSAASRTNASANGPALGSTNGSVDPSASALFDGRINVLRYQVTSPSDAPTRSDDGLRWVWQYAGPDFAAPPVTILVEDSMGPYERHLLKLAAGRDDVFAYAEHQHPERIVDQYRRALRSWSEVS